MGTRSLLVLPLLLAGCGLLGDDEPPRLACDPDAPFSAEARVIPCKGVDGVAFGQTWAEVEAALGPPSLVGWADGIYRGWRSYAYLEGPSAGLSVDFLIEDDGASFGPVDMFMLEPPYSGKTQKGIGIGSSLGEVEDVYGEPANVFTKENNPGYALYTYCFGDQRLNLGIQTDTVSGMNLGYYEPMAEGDGQHCR